MKLSKSLLHEKEIGQRIFNSSLSKAKKMLTGIFEINLENSDPQIIKIINEPENFKYEILFDKSGRKITALFNYEKDNADDDILSEVLRIKELVVVNIPVKEVPDNIDKTIINLMELLENKYGIDFTPLDPGDRDKNIKEINIGEKDDSWNVKFTTDDHESEFKAEYIHKPGETTFLKVEQHKEHVVYFE